MDNGPPFASVGAWGLTRLAVSWVKLGIRLERIDPGCPQQNGRRERMHRTLKAETSQPPAASPAEQQVRFDEFRHGFNEERPHEALDQMTPASCDAASPRPYPERIEEPWYDADHQVRRVRPDGTIKWHGEFVFICDALAGEPVGVAELDDDGGWIVRFADLPLGLIEAKGKKISPVCGGPAGPPQTGNQPGQCQLCARSHSVDDSPESGSATDAQKDRNYVKNTLL
jgi:putative transposase